MGEFTRPAAQVVVDERCRIGARYILHGGAVIGGDGFGFAPVEGRWEKIEQLAAVAIGDDVEIGADSCVDRSQAAVQQGNYSDGLCRSARSSGLTLHWDQQAGHPRPASLV
jgi:UDP-3-O-[3-hydroxymyristoyl] glucosamine N-acyltransferase